VLRTLPPNESDPRQKKNKNKKKEQEEQEEQELCARDGHPVDRRQGVRRCWPPSSYRDTTTDHFESI